MGSLGQAEAGGCKSCGGSSIIVFHPFATQERVLLTGFGYAVVEAGPLGGVYHRHTCYCSEGQIKDACRYILEDLPGMLAGEDVDDFEGGCLWVENPSYGIKFCVDFWCNEGQTEPIPHLPDPC